ncbi:SWPV2-ORF286 [Shearwaterpox virus]|uniref:SWPV2-ORF286 n=1 Tax=Shearwaterpox virus TaxID=1974596 RepID=A0A1V0QGQ1_CNPV|nr:SWPV2-ORF286 [Shearwaterpox virus]QRM15932.1 ankyrin repeat protein [Penguinpox virus 2]QRM16269.1 ankyrin repeat protein [Albatrosspox virus]
MASSDLYYIMIMDTDADYDNCRYCKRMLLQGAKFGNTGLVRYLLKNKVDPNFSDEYLRAPIHYAVNSNNPSIVKLLVDYGSEIDIFDDDFEYPITEAVKSNYLEVAKTLIDAGADKTIFNDFDLLHNSISKKHREMTELLIDNGTDVLMKDADDRIPLHYAAYNDDIEGVLHVLNYVSCNLGYEICEKMIYEILSCHDIYSNEVLSTIIDYFMIIKRKDTGSFLRDSHNIVKKLIDDTEELNAV